MKSKAYINIKKWLAAPVRFLFRIKGHNVENEPDESEGPYVVIANHIANIDPISICAVIDKQQPHFMAKKELFKVPIVNWLVSLMGAFPVDRGGGDVGAIKKSVAILKDGQSMGIFPQGHRYPGVDPRTTETKNGAALICTRAEADIVPAYIVRKNNTHKLFRKTWVIIGEPIPFSELGYDRDASGEYNRITELVFDRICALGESFSEEEAKKHIKEMKAKNKK